MNNILIDVFSKSVSGFNRNCKINERVICFPYDLDKLNKTIRIKEEYQKENEFGEKLFKYNIMDGLIDEEIYEEVTEDFIDKLEGVEKIPILIKNEFNKTINFLDNYNDFTLEDVIQFKYQNILEESFKNNLLVDMFLETNDFNEEDRLNYHSGFGFIILLPNQSVRTNILQLNKPAMHFKLLEFESQKGVSIYLNNVKFENNEVVLDTEVEEIEIKFVNEDEINKLIYNYAIGY